MLNMEKRTWKNIHFIRVRGDSKERARMHVALLREEILKGALPALAKKNEWLIRRGPGLVQHPLLQGLIIRFYKKLLLPVMGLSLTPEEKQMIEAVSQDLGLTYHEICETIFQADAMMLLARTTLMKYALSNWIPGGLPGCTSGVALKEWTKGGKLLACRNLDYPVVGPWEKQPTVVFHEPTEKGEIPYVALTTAGVHVGGVTAMNREGITLAAHAHFGKKNSIRGRAIVLIGDEVIRKAKTLGQAVDLVKKNRTFANWAFVMSSGKENHGIVIEMTPGKIAVRDAQDGWLTHSNFFHSQELQKDEVILCGSYCEDLESRLCQLKKILESHRGNLEPSHMAVALGNHQDYFSGQERVFGNTISVVTTVKSAVFEPESQKFWMASRHESPMGLGDFCEVDVNRFWKETDTEYDQAAQILPGYRPKEPKLIEAIHHYRMAYEWFHSNSDNPLYREKAYACIQKALKVYPADGHLWIQAGIMAFSLEHFEDAKLYLEKSKNCGLSLHVEKVRDLYLARCFDVLGDRSKALEIYSLHSNAKEPGIRKAFKKGLARPYHSSEISRIVMDLQFPDTFQY